MIMCVVISCASVYVGAALLTVSAFAESASRQRIFIKFGLIFLLIAIICAFLA